MEQEQEQVIEQWVRRFESLTDRLHDKELRPHPTKAAKHKVEIEAFAAEFLRDVVEPMSSVLHPLEEQEGPQDVEHLKSAVLSVAISIAGACAASGASRPMKRLFSEVQDLAPSFEQRREAKLAERELDAFVLLTWGRHLAAEAKLRASRKAFDAAKGALVHEQDGVAALATIIDEAKAQGVAVKSAPSVTGRDGFARGCPQCGTKQSQDEGHLHDRYAADRLQTVAARRQKERRPDGRVHCWLSIISTGSRAA